MGDRLGIPGAVSFCPAEGALLHPFTILLFNPHHGGTGAATAFRLVSWLLSAPLLGASSQMHLGLSGVTNLSEPQPCNACSKHFQPSFTALQLHCLSTTVNQGPLDTSNINNGGYSRRRAHAASSLHKGAVMRTSVWLYGIPLNTDPISSDLEAKQGRSWLVLGWEDALEYQTINCVRKHLEQFCLRTPVGRMKKLHRRRSWVPAHNAFGLSVSQPQRASALHVLLQHFQPSSQHYNVHCLPTTESKPLDTSKSSHAENISTKKNILLETRAADSSFCFVPFQNH
ncbi:hypothetical protein CRENBAI_023374 [Crenichthys baileyi]|uniref:Uncharacterized protein n=1 Tax=Crenichthys baileyi TaxID=28760 RepID=A0AAV9S389_9TELE